MSNKSILLVARGGPSWIGGLHYIKNLVKSISRFAPERYGKIKIHLLVYSSDQVSQFIDLEKEINTIHVYNDIVARASLWRRTIWKARSVFSGVVNPPIDHIMREEGIDFVYPALPASSFRHYRFAEWIPDFQYRYFPDGSNEQEIRERKEAFGTIASASPLIYVSSVPAKVDCEELFPQSKGKVHVMPFTVNTGKMDFVIPLTALKKKYNIPEKYFIISNLLAPTKNLQVVIDAVARLKSRGLNFHVVVTGDIHDYRNPEFKNFIFQKVNILDVREQFIFLGLIDRVEQKQLLANAVSIIQPSRFEGWNTLVEEAKSIGKRIILSDIPVHLDQAPSCGRFFRDNDADDLSGIMQDESDSYVPVEFNSIEETEAYRENIRSFTAHFLSVSLGY